MFENYIGTKVIVRGKDAGVYYGTLAEVDGDTVELANVRNLWYWSGANCLMDMSIYGVKNPESCNFSPAVQSIGLLGICEILPTTEEAQASIEGVKEWKIQ